MAKINPGTPTGASAADQVARESNPAAGTDAGNAPVTHEPNVDLPLGVDLSLTLRFGQRVLTLREIVDLNADAIIELDREVQEPPPIFF